MKNKKPKSYINYLHDAVDKGTLDISEFRFWQRVYKQLRRNPFAITDAYLRQAGGLKRKYIY